MLSVCVSSFPWVGIWKIKNSFYLSNRVPWNIKIDKYKEFCKIPSGRVIYEINGEYQIDNPEYKKLERGLFIF